MHINLKKFLPSVLSLAVLAVTVFSVSLISNDKTNQTVDSVMEGAENTKEVIEIKEIPCEMRATWIPFMDLQVKEGFSEEKFKQNYLNILDRVTNTKLNTVFVQVRPFSDSFYPSKFYPWSHIITGDQGVDPGFDPLEFMIKEAHLRDLKFHAWIVPMRIASRKMNLSLANDNPCMIWKRENPDKFKLYVVDDEEFLYYDPAYEEVRELIINGVKEIVENYDVDGVNFDDYFYPANNLWVDKKNYDVSGNLSKSENLDENIIKKRKDNINTLISGVYAAVKAVKEDVLFGVCPQGNFENSRRSGADIDKWASESGYVDYLCPEIYTNSVNPVLPFEKAASDWKKLVTNDKIKLYAGLGLYKTGTDKYDNGTWLNSDDIIMNQIEFLRKEGYDGFSLYSSVYLDKSENKNEVLNVIKIIN